MRRLIKLFLIAFTCLASLSSAYAADIADGVVAYRAGDYTKALQHFRPLAAKGDPSAQYSLGFLYANGKGVEHSDSTAARWYKKAAEQGYPLAQYRLGILYGNGRGVEKSASAAVHWYRKAAKQGNADAQYNLGVMLANGQVRKSSDGEAILWFQKAADQGHVNAQFNLAKMYSEGRGAGQSYAQAVAWYRKAAAQGDADAQNNLGVIYAKGQAVEKNYTQAFLWFARAAQQGSEKAKSNIKEYRKQLRAYRVLKPVVNVRSNPSIQDEIVTKLEKDSVVYRLGDEKDWKSIYIADSHQLGYVAEWLLDEVNPSNISQANNSAGYQAASAAKPGI